MSTTTLFDKAVADLQVEYNLRKKDIEYRNAALGICNTEIDRLRKLIDQLNDSIISKDSEIEQLKEKLKTMGNLASINPEKKDRWDLEREEIIEKIDLKKFRRLKVGEHMKFSDRWLDSNHVWRPCDSGGTISNGSAIVIRKINSCGCDDVSP